MKALIERMYRSMHWANREVMGSLRDSPEAQVNALPLLAHVVGTEHNWLARLRGIESKHPVKPELSLDECEALESENARDYAALLQSLSESDLAATVRFRDSRGTEFTMARVDILIHVVTHGSYHRGQIANAVARSGAQSVDTDFIQFARTVEPIDVA